MYVRLLGYPFSFLLTVVCACALSLAAQVAGVQNCRAAEIQGGNFIFILDSSGSMAGQVQGKVKIDAAKEALSRLINELPGSVKVGLVAYGHRQKGDCSDVEELSPLGVPDKEALISRIKGLNPRGMTPITFSVRKVVEGLKGVEENSTIVLVSDGEETCKGDPCALVRELKASGIKFVLHVIGFDVNERQKAELSCIARAGGGSYFSARNAGELAVAAKKAIEKPVILPGTLNLKALSYGKPVRAFSEVFKAGVEDAGQQEKVGEGWLENGAASYQLVPGVYDVKVVNRGDASAPSVSFQGITIEPGQAVEKVADFSGGLLKVKALRNGVPCRAYSLVYKSGEGEEKVTEGWTDAESPDFKLPPGVYDLVVENRVDVHKPTVSFKEITLEAGKSTEKIAEFFGATLKVKALRNEKPLSAYCVIYKAVQDEDKDKEKVAEGMTGLEGKAFNLPLGAYDVMVENQEDPDKPTISFPDVAIEAGKDLEKIADFSGGTLKVTAQRNGKPLSALSRVYKADGSEGKDRKVLTQLWTGKDGAIFKLQPGVYDLVVENQEDVGKPTQSFTKLEIENGKTIEKVAEFSGGTLKVKAIRNGKPLSAMCLVFTGQGDERKQVTRSMTRDDGAVFQLMPGTYDIEVENHTDAGKPKVSLPGITIESGKSVEKEVEFSGGTLTVKAVRNGKPLSAMCIVFTGQGDERKQVTRGMTRDEGAVFQLMPGTYDIEVENQTDANKPKVSLAGITIESGKRVEKEVEFSGGTLTVKAVRNGKPLSAMCIVFAGQGAERKQVTRSMTRDEGAVFQLMPGTYDIEVENQTDANKPKVSLAGITIESGKRVEKEVEFSGGTLTVKAVRNGKPLSAMCIVFTGQGAERKQVTRGMTQDKGVVFQLLPGTYDIEVENQTDASKPRVSLPGITIEGGKSVEKTVEFSGGTLMVKAVRNGKPLSAMCIVFTGQGDERKQVTRSMTQDKGAVFQLLPGTYDIEVENQTDASKPKVSLPGVTIEAGKSIEKTAEFSGGTLTVKAVRNGKPLSALCVVFTGEGADRKQVTRSQTRNEGAVFQLVPGVYSLSVEDKGEKKEVNEVTIEADKNRTVDIQF